MDENEWIIHDFNLEFLKLLGSGTSGEVHHVKVTTKNGESYEAAAKKFKPSHEESDTKEQENELEILRNLRHPNIIKFFCAVLSPVIIIVTEFAAKGSLSDFLKNQTSLSVEKALEWARQAASAVEYLHSNDVVHHDIKSGNFVITSDDILKLCDFGISRTLVSTKKTEHITGTVPWMAPEVFVDNLLSKASDVYALGIVIWELLSCQYADRERANIMFHVKQYKLRPTIPQHCPPELEELLERCWDEDHRRRPNINSVVSIIESIQRRLKSKDTTEKTAISMPPADENGNTVAGSDLPFEAEKHCLPYNAAPKNVTISVSNQAEMKQRDTSVKKNLPFEVDKCLPHNAASENVTISVSNQAEMKERDIAVKKKNKYRRTLPVLKARTVMILIAVALAVCVTLILISEHRNILPGSHNGSWDTSHTDIGHAKDDIKTNKLTENGHTTKFDNYSFKSPRGEPEEAETSPAIPTGRPTTDVQVSTDNVDKTSFMHDACYRELRTLASSNSTLWTCNLTMIFNNKRLDVKYVCETTCKAGFETHLQGERIRECFTKNGYWTGPSIDCQPQEQTVLPNRGNDTPGLQPNDTIIGMGPGAIGTQANGTLDQNG